MNAYFKVNAIFKGKLGYYQNEPNRDLQENLIMTFPKEGKVTIKLDNLDDVKTDIYFYEEDKSKEYLLSSLDSVNHEFTVDVLPDRKYNIHVWNKDEKAMKYTIENIFK